MNSLGPRGRQILAVIAVAVVVLLAGFAFARRNGATTTQNMTTVKVVMGYVPNVQFAPFYAAVKLGYYQAAGLNVQFNYATEPDALKLLSEGSDDFVDSGGDEVLAGGASGLRVKYVLTQYSRFPTAIFFLKSSGIKKVSDLKDKTIGIPGKYGASYYGLLALLRANHVSPASVKIEPIGYNQVSEVAAGKVDAAVGYAPNEPVALRNLGKKVGEFDVYRWANIAGAGIATSDSLISKNPSLVRAFVQATLQGLAWTNAHPAKAFTLCRQSIPKLTDLKLWRAVLYRAIAFWKPASVRLGRMDQRVWNLTARILVQDKILAHSVNASKYYTNRFVD